MDVLIRVTDLAVILTFAIALLASLSTGHDLLASVIRAAVASVAVAILGRFLAKAVRSSWEQNIEQASEQQSSGTGH
ncbi:MAG: hypothetical protein ACUVTZ_06230 [Armatimonadota bacterium]